MGSDDTARTVPRATAVHARRNRLLSSTHAAGGGSVLKKWEIPQGLRVAPDGSWRVGDLHVVHPGGLRYLKSHLVFEEGGAFVVDGPQRMPVAIEGPAFEVVSLVLDAPASTASVVLDDGSVEPLADGSVGMHERSGRFEAVVRGGVARAVFGRGAHQALLEHAVEIGGAFFLEVGTRRLALRT